jgi:hypothetical protein
MGFGFPRCGIQKPEPLWDVRLLKSGVLDGGSLWEAPHITLNAKIQETLEVKDSNGMIPASYTTTEAMKE